MFPLPKYKMTAYKLYEFQRRIVAFNAFFGYETIIFGYLPKVGLQHKDRTSVRLKSVACQRAFVQQVQNPTRVEIDFNYFQNGLCAINFTTIVFGTLVRIPDIKCSVTAGTDAISA